MPPARIPARSSGAPGSSFCPPAPTGSPLTLNERYANGKFGSGMILIGAVDRRHHHPAGRSCARLRRSGHAARRGHDHGQAARRLADQRRQGLHQQGRGQRRLRELRREPDHRCRRRQSRARSASTIWRTISARSATSVSTAPPGSGAIGIAMQRKWPGPALLQRVTVHGFGTGIAVANTEYGVTLDHVQAGGSARRRPRQRPQCHRRRRPDRSTHRPPRSPITRRTGLIVLTNAELRRTGGECDRLSTIAARSLPAV